MLDRTSMPGALPRAAQVSRVRTARCLSLGALAASLVACAAEPPPTGLFIDETIAPMGAAADARACGPAPSVSSPHEIGDAIVGPAFDRQDAPQVACDGDLCLVTWFDQRAPVPRIYAARVSTAGGVLDPFGIYIGDGYAPRVAAGGGQFLVAFEGADGQIGFGTPHHVRGARVAADGSVLDPGGFAITAPGGGSAEYQPMVAFSGADFQVIWQRTPDTWYPWWPTDILGARVGLDGSVIDPDGAAPEGALLVPSALLLAFARSSAGSYLLWMSDNGASIRGSRLDAALTLLEPAGVVIAAPQGEQYLRTHALSFDGSQNIVAWSTFPNGQARVRRILADGSLRDEPPLPLTGTPFDEILGVTSAGSRMIAVGMYMASGDDWGSPPGLAVARLDEDGAPLDPEAHVLADPAYPAAIASAGDKALVAWTDHDCVDSNCWDYMPRTTVKIGWIDPGSGELEAPPTAVALSANEHRQPVVVPQGSGALVLWSDSRQGEDGEQGIYATRVNAKGEALDPAGIPITSDAIEAPQAAFDGQSTLVVWPRGYYTGGFGPGAAWVGQDGALIDTGPIDLSMVWGSTLLAPHPQGGAALVYGDYGVLDLVRIDPSGAVLGPYPVSIPGSHADELLAALSYDGANYLLVVSRRDWVDSSIDLHGAVISPAGELLGPGVFPIALDQPGLNAIDAAFVNGKHVLLWSDALGGVRAAQVTADGEVLQPGGFEVAHYSGPAPGGPDYRLEGYAAVSRGKHGALLAWKAPGSAAGTQEIHGAELGPSGAFGPRFTLAAEPGIQGQLALGRLGGGKALLAYERFVADAPYVASRVQARVIGGACGGQH